MILNGPRHTERAAPRRSAKASAERAYDDTNDSRNVAHAARNGPRDRRRDRGRAAAAESRPRADRIRELRQPRDSGSCRIGIHEQVRRGVSGTPLLRRLRVRRRRRARRHLAREVAVRRRSCQRAAALRCAGQHGGVLHAAEAGRYRSRHEPRARRPPDARPSAELLGQAVHDRSVRREEG